MKIIGINGSPRRDGNSAQMLDSALAGAKAQGAQVERIDLSALDFSGCVSCFACKRLGGESFGRCGHQDGLTAVLDKILEADGLILSTPIYFESTPGMVRNFFERLWFPAQQYAKNYASAYKKRIRVGLIFTMNLPSEDAYKDLIRSHRQLCTMLLGKTTVVTAVDTMQFDDYSQYASELFDGDAKRVRRETVFPEECQKAYHMGVAMAQ